ncbi:MAG: Gfo/Idh/MocA family oxidoreductase, partial [Acidisphaera sp.]|nr:Gfo/Idh/MocA family oxidoreductase [Acidisphaera sp.]
MPVSVRGRRVRYAVVGAGWISQARFMPGLARAADAELAAVVTGDPEKARALAARYGIRSLGYDEYDALLASGDIDAVYLALPNAMHLDFSLRTLQAGVHLLLEKPMAVSSAQCRAISAAAERSGAKLMIGYRLHFEPATLEAIRIVRSGEIGTPRFFSSAFAQHVAPANHRAKSGFWAGPVADMGPYPINAARNLFAAEPIEVTAAGLHTDGKFGDLHDTVSVVLRFPQERLAQFTVSYAAAPFSAYRVLGTAGSLEVRPAYDFGVGLGIDFTIGDKTGQRRFPETEQFGAEAQYFAGCILHDRAPEPDGEEGFFDVRVVEAVERALQT